MTTASEMSARQRGKQRKRDAIRAAAASLMASKQLDEITMREVAQLAGVGEATLFRYVSGKSDLLHMVYGDELDAVLDRIEERDASFVAANSTHVTGDHCVLRVRAIYFERCAFYRRNPENSARYLREGFRPEHGPASRNIAQGDRTIRLVASIIDTGQANGVLDLRPQPLLVAQNCHAIYMHEIDRTPVRGFDPDAIWDRVGPRLDAQLNPLVPLAGR
ncbi:TetR/AcrR family transcriptional regulator [Agrococcus sp. BE272]|uniref:TetR/AcrR family transcriptional regulator n=1 Tax=Agrococcus sp. BE272 TaxID=2817727 RepID=UPI0028672075|nr:TetR/AcrR family transcriptional regulator [Agrococcus sp. BE272]MDR7233583.1 AcrR family transcriptional regulator [Agrococcus sp. BE272]